MGMGMKMRMRMRLDNHKLFEDEKEEWKKEMLFERRKGKKSGVK